MTPQELLDAVRTVEARVGPGCELVRSQVGNISVVSAAGECVGFIDLGRTTPPEDLVNLIETG